MSYLKIPQQDQAGCSVGKSLISGLKENHGWGDLNPDCEAQLEEALAKSFNCGVEWQVCQTPGRVANIEMIPGKYYFISFGDQTQLVVRFRENQVTTYNFYDCLHYWNRHESYRNNNAYCVHSGIIELRPATLPEKNALINKEIEHGDI